MTAQATDSPTDVLTDDLLLRLSTDLPYYSAACLRIRPKELVGASLPYLEFNEAQRRVHQAIARQRRETGRVRVIILKARQEGVSTYVAARFFRGCHLWPHRHALIVADDLDRAGELHQIYSRFHGLLPSELVVPRTASQRKRELALANGSQIKVESARDEEAGRATTLQFVHASEFALWLHAGDTFLSFMQAVPDHGSEVIIESTADGVGNPFHQMWLQAEAGESGWLAIFLPWWIHEEYTVGLSPVEEAELLGSLDDWESEALYDGIEYEGERHKLTPGQIAWRRRTIAEKAAGDPRRFRQEYPSTAREAFLVSGHPFFSEESLERYERSTVKPERWNLLDLDGAVGHERAERGYLRVWRKPALEQICPECLGRKSSQGRTRCLRCEGRGVIPTLYVIGADTAEGREVAAVNLGFTDPEGESGGTDFSSATVFEVESRAKVAEWHARAAPEFFARQLHLLGYLYSSADLENRGLRRPALIGVERNHSSGQTVLRILSEELGYPNLFVHQRVNQRTKEITEKLGWITDGETRPVILDELARVLREDSIEMPSAESLGEYWTFVRNSEGRPEAQVGCHDDRVIADAIALEMARRAPRPPRGRYSETERRDTPTGL